MPSSKSYVILRDWYLARLRNLAVEAELSADRTPASFIAADKELIKQLAAESSEDKAASESKTIPLLRLLAFWLFLQLLMLCLLSYETGGLDRGVSSFVSLNLGALAALPAVPESFLEKLSFLCFYVFPLVFLALVPASKLDFASWPGRLHPVKGYSGLSLETALFTLLSLAMLCFSSPLLLQDQTQVVPSALKMQAHMLVHYQSMVAWLCVFCLALLVFCKYLCQKLSAVSVMCDRIMPEPVSLPDPGADIVTRMLTLEGHLNEQRMREEAIADYSDKVLLSLTPELKIESMSPNVLQLWGYQLHDLLGCGPSQIIFSEDLASFENAATNSKGKGKNFSHECRVLTKDNSIIDCRFDFDWSDKFQRIFSICQDISAQKNLERTRQDFIAKLTHDMRSPLGAAKLVLSAFLEKMFGELPDGATKVLSQAQAGLTRVLVLIEEIIDSEKLSAGQVDLFLDDYWLGKLCLEVIEELRASAESRRIKFIIPDNDLRVTVDSQLLLRVISNFLSNALSFTPDGEEIRVDILSSGDSALLKVTDKGPGVPKELQQVIFQRFAVSTARVDNRQRQSSGLGLSICRDIIKAHGGSLGVDSEPPNGSCFWFRVPLATDES